LIRNTRQVRGRNSVNVAVPVCTQCDQLFERVELPPPLANRPAHLVRLPVFGRKAECRARSVPPSAVIASIAVCVCRTRRARICRHLFVDRADGGSHGRRLSSRAVWQRACQRRRCGNGAVSPLAAPQGLKRRPEELALLPPVRRPFDLGLFFAAPIIQRRRPTGEQDTAVPLPACLPLAASCQLARAQFNQPRALGIQHDFREDILPVGAAKFSERPHVSLGRWADHGRGRDVHSTTHRRQCQHGRQRAEQHQRQSPHGSGRAT